MKRVSKNGINNSKNESKEGLNLLLKLEIEAAFLSQEPIEDISLANAMKQGKTGEYVDAE